MRIACLPVLLLIAITTAAHGQPRWDPKLDPRPPPGWDRRHGWETEAVDRIMSRASHEERRRKMREDFEATSRKMDEDFDRHSRRVFGIFFAAVGLMLAGALLTAGRRRRRPDAWTVPVDDSPLLAHAAPAPMWSSGDVDVSVLRLAIDGRASKFVQTELAAIVKDHGGTSADERARLVREVSILLRRVRDSWIYGGAENEPMRRRDEALAAFARHVDDARSRLRVRPTEPVVTTSNVSLILVSIIVAARGELMTVTDLATGEDLRRALEAAVHRPAADLLAVEIVWEPASADGRVSSIDLEAHYRASELHPLDGALAGKTFCRYCAGPFPGELVSCPHCGAPAIGSRSG
jgi:hypothetical protein